MRWLFFAVLLHAAFPAAAMFMRPEWVPVDRLVQNTSRYVNAHPSEASAHYALGRLHYLAFTLKGELIPAFASSEDGPARPVPDYLVGLPVAGAREQRALELAREELGARADTTKDRQEFFQAVSRHRKKLEEENWIPPRSTPAVLVDHAAKALSSLRKAMELDPRDALFPLSLGSLLVQFADWNEEARAGDLPEVFRGDLRRQARAHFFNAWKLAHPNDSKARSLPVAGLTQFVSYEAGNAFLRLAEAEPQNLSAEEKEAVARMKTGLAALEKLPTRAITPLVMSLQPRETLAEMLLPNSSVRFDMSGFGMNGPWSWVSPDLGLLVWDPLERGKITSGRQLFGNFSFGGIWRDGFEALRALDDNGDGQVADAELAGVSIWFDLNGDGRSNRSEVVPVKRLSVRALSCLASTNEGIHLANPTGAIFFDERTVPVWDWMATAPAGERLE